MTAHFAGIVRSRCVHAARDRVCVFFKAERRPAVCVRHVFLARTCQRSCPRLLLAVGAAPDVGASLPLTACFQPSGCVPHVGMRDGAGAPVLVF